QYCEELNLPRVIFVNKMDRENADFDRVLDQLRERYGKCIAALQLPIGREASFKGEVNVVNRKAFMGKDEGEIPADMRSAVEDRRAQLVEIAAESDDKLIEKYFESGELSDEEIRAGLEHGVAGGTLVPVLCGSAS